MTDDDCVLQDLKVQEALAVNWVNRAKQVRKSASMFVSCCFDVMRAPCWARRLGEVIVFAVGCVHGCRKDLSTLWLAQCCAVS